MQNLIATSHLTAVVGLGITGLSAARFLARNNRPFVLLDTRPEPPLLQQFLAEFPDVTPECGPLNQDSLTAVQQIVLSPGVAKKQPAIEAAEKAGVEIIGDIELFARFAKAPIVAITGSNGKTTVTTLVGGMAQAAGLNVLVGGNIGTPVLDLLEQPTPDFYVLELSSFQLETTYQLNALAATVLNISKDHLDRYPSFVAYHMAKMRILFGAQNVLVNRDDLLTRGPIAQNVKQNSFGLNPPDLNDFGVIQQNGEDFLAKGLNAIMPVKRLQLYGAHNIANALAAMALVDVMGGLNQAALDFLAGFTGVAHRCQLTATINGVRYFNDSKATNVGATVAAVNGLSKSVESGNGIHLILGGQGKGGDFAELAKALSPSVVTALVLGEDQREIVEALQNNGKAIDIITVDSIEAAVAQAHSKAKTGDIVLLSPACASFDMFTGYEQRGQVFTAAVEAIA